MVRAFGTPRYIWSGGHLKCFGQACSTLSGPESGRPCVFPFSYLNNTYNSCTFHYSREKAWCATHTDEQVAGHKTGDLGW